MKIIPIEQFEEITIRVSPGKYEKFPVIDNKGLFVIQKGCNVKTGYLLETFNAEGKSYYGVYTCVNGMAILTAAFSSDEVITRAVAIIVLKSFPYLFADLKKNLKDIFPELRISLHIGLEEPHNSIIYVSIENEYIRLTEIKDPRNLGENELYFLSAIPGLAEKIQQTYK